eukprot:359660-Chlamydomonas_euryale.AAC.5
MQPLMHSMHEPTWRSCCAPHVNLRQQQRVELVPLQLLEARLVVCVLELVVLVRDVEPGRGSVRVVLCEPVRHCRHPSHVLVGFAAPAAAAAAIGAGVFWTRTPARPGGGRRHAPTHKGSRPRAGDDTRACERKRSDRKIYLLHQAADVGRRLVAGRWQRQRVGSAAHAVEPFCLRPPATAPLPSTHAWHRALCRASRQHQTR